MSPELSLWSQTKDLTGPLGKRLSSAAEVLHEIQDLFTRSGHQIGRNQIKIILESVPEIFPEDWEYPGGFDDLSDEQKETGFRITGDNPQVPIYGDSVQEVIKAAVSFREKHGK